MVNFKIIEKALFGKSKSYNYYHGNQKLFSKRSFNVWNVQVFFKYKTAICLFHIPSLYYMLEPYNPFYSKVPKGSKK